LSSICFEPEDSPSGRWFVYSYGMVCFTYIDIGSLVGRRVCTEESVRTHYFTY